MPYFEYAIRVPTASSIYPRVIVEEILSAMIDGNVSRPVHKRLPMEILLLVHKEVHPENPLWEEIRSTWTTDITVKVKPDIDYHRYLRTMFLDQRWKTWSIIPQDSAERYSTSVIQNKIRVFKSISSADLLYRLRCLFPEIQILSQGRVGKSIWSIFGIQHIQTGLFFSPSEYMGAAFVRDFPPRGANITEEAGNAFATDAIRLMNAFSEKVDGNRLAYFHPAVDADYPTPDEHFVADPGYCRDRLQKRDVAEPYIPWHPVFLSATDITSFKSLLPNLNYNIESRTVDAVNGTANLTTIISSSLLFYRLLCYYVWEQDNINNTPPITSVWQVKLAHRRTNASIIFMDHYGLFDIRGGGDAKEVMTDIAALVTALCSDECSHPYDGTVAGCVA